MLKLSKLLDFNRKYSVPIHRSNESLLTPFYDFQQDFDNLFQKFYRSFPVSVGELDNLNISPSVDIVEDESNIKVEIELPGVDEKDIKVYISPNMLNIKASKEISKKDEGKTYSMREIGYGSYERNIPLPDNVDIDKAESTFKKGMLWVNLPKKYSDKSKVRELEIQKL